MSASNDLLDRISNMIGSSSSHVDISVDAPPYTNHAMEVFKALG